MKKIFILSLLYTITLLGCKKGVEPQFSQESCLVLAYSYLDFYNSTERKYQFQYNDKKQLIKSTATGGNIGTPQIITYSYNSNKIDKIEEFGSNSRRVTTYELNDRGLAVRQSFSEDPYIYVTEYEYDQEGYLIKSLIASYIKSNNNLINSNEVTHIYDNGNLIKTQDKYGTILYEYYTDKIDNRNWGDSFLGKKSKNLLKRELYNYKRIVQVDRTSNDYSYEFDINGNIKKVNISSVSAIDGKTYNNAYANYVMSCL